MTNSVDNLRALEMRLFEMECLVMAVRAEESDDTLLRLVLNRVTDGVHDMQRTLYNHRGDLRDNP